MIWSIRPMRRYIPTYHHGYINTVKHCSRFPSFENLCTTRVAFVLCGTCRCVRPGLTVRTRCSVHADDARAHSTQVDDTWAKHQQFFCRNNILVVKIVHGRVRRPSSRNSTSRVSMFYL